jgi:hypothetical protein
MFHCLVIFVFAVFVRKKLTVLMFIHIQSLLSGIIFMTKIRIYSPFLVNFNPKKKVITINYNESILKEPSLDTNLNIIKKNLIPLIRNSFRR